MTTLTNLACKAARHYWLSTLPVLLGVAVGSAVLTGALLVGDSLRGSLRARSERQLNGVVSAYLGTQFVRQELASSVPEAIPAVMLTGSLEAEQGRLGRVTVTGLDAAGLTRFALPPVGERGVIISYRVATRLGLKSGDSVRVGVEKSSAVPRSSLLGRRGLDEVAGSLNLTVEHVLPAEHPAGDFSLQPSPVAPMTAFAGLKLLQDRIERPGRVNAILAHSVVAPDVLADQWSLADHGLKLRVSPERKDYLSLESESLVLEPRTVVAAERAASESGGMSAGTISYLANAIVAGTQPLAGDDAGHGRRVVPYSILTALPVDAAPPLGGFLPEGVASLEGNEIVLADWADSPLKELAVGEKVTVTYFKPELETGTEEASATFTLKGFVPLSGVTGDRDLTPEFPGVTDKLSIGDWDLPFPIVNARIHKRDEEYWEKYRATPKAYINFDAGKTLFGSRYGAVTSVRIAPPPGETADQYLPRYQAELLRSLNPASRGLVVRPVRDEVMAASRGGTDFSVLFLAFSGLLILAALLLVGLLLRLLVARRAKELGILLATGYTPRQVRSLLLLETMLVAAFGNILGLILATAYAQGMLYLLVTVWPDAELGRYLQFHPTWPSYIVGAVAVMVISYVTIRLSFRGLHAVPVPGLLRGRAAADDAATLNRRSSVTLPLGLLAVGLVTVLAGRLANNPDYRAGAFFGGGLLLLGGCLALGRLLLKLATATTVPASGVWQLGVRRAGENLPRTLLIASMVAIAGFLVVAVESFRRSPDQDFSGRQGGGGGFALYGETDVALARPFLSGPGRDELLEQFERQAQSRPLAERKAFLRSVEDDLSGVTAIGLPLQGGDDASCVNLYQAGRPRVAGVPPALVERGAFRFGDTLAKTEAERANPWALLSKPTASGRVPVIAEQNTAMFMLKTGLGGRVELTDGDGQLVEGEIVALLQDSLFQSELLVSEADFTRLYPRQQGARIFLIDAPAEARDRVASRLEQGLATQGMQVTTTTAKVARYQAVVGAYLTTFQMLGSLALLLAVLGVGVVILRSVWERAGEIALLRAVGYRSRSIRALTLGETLAVLGLGLGSGVIAAGLSVLPNVAFGGRPPWLAVGLLLGATLVAASAVTVLALARVTRLNVVETLRQEG